MMITEFETQIGTYGVKLGKVDGEPYCHIRLLPYECMLFRAELDWLMVSGNLEDGDATHEVPKDVIEQIKNWAVEHGYEPIEI